MKVVFRESFAKDLKAIRDKNLLARIRRESFFKSIPPCIITNMENNAVHNRITIEQGKRSGQPCIRGLRITVWDVLSWLGSGMSEKQILEDYPELEMEDFRAVYDYAARMGRRVAL